MLVVVDAGLTVAVVERSVTDIEELDATAAEEETTGGAETATLELAAGAGMGTLPSSPSVAHAKLSLVT